MWAEAAKWLAKFPEVVVTAVDADGYPVSIRQTAAHYDPTTGRMPVAWPPDLTVAEGPATILCHAHDEKAWNLKAMQIKGRLERCADECTFISTAFTPPQGTLIAFYQFSKSGRTAARRYLDRRGIAAPIVNWAAIDQLWLRARNGQK